jgi:hypothetical protein
MKRQRSRNRSAGTGGKPQHNANRAFESNGPDGVKIRGAAQHVFEKYQQLARDALTAGDRVLAESYQQHAEHYFRVLRAVQPNRSASDIIGRDAFASGYDIDFEDEGNNETEASSEASEPETDRGDWRQENRYEGQGRQQRDERPQNDRNDRNRDDRSNQERGQRDDRPRDRGFNRDDRPRNDRYRDDRARDDRPREDRTRDETPREDRASDNRQGDTRQNEGRQNEGRQNEGRQSEGRQNEGRQNENRQRGDRPRYDRSERVSDPLAVVEPQATPLTSEAEPTSSPILRSQDGGVSEAPAFLQARPETRAEPKPEAVADEGEARPRVRRRRAPRSFEPAAGEESAPTAAEDA